MATLNLTNEQVKIAVIGNEEIGKTCLLMSYRPSATSECPSIFNSIQISKDVKINGNPKPLQLLLCDTGSGDEYTQLRGKAYRNVDVILICFDILNISSLECVDTKWMPEVDKYAAEAVLVLVGLKSDKRAKKDNEENENEIPMDVITQYKTKYDFIDYVETSALRKHNVDQAFEVGIAEFLIHGGQHRRSTQVTSDEDIDPDVNDINSIVGTHQKQWNQHLKETGMNNDDVFNQYKNVNSNPQSQLQPQSMVGSAQYGAGAMSYNAQSYNMVQQQRLAAMSYQPNQYGYAQSYASNPANGSLITAHNVAPNNLISEDKELDIPPPPQSPESMKLTKISVTDDMRLGGSGSIDYGLEANTPKKGCCIIL